MPIFRLLLGGLGPDRHTSTACTGAARCLAAGSWLFAHTVRR